MLWIGKVAREMFLDLGHKNPMQKASCITESLAVQEKLIQLHFNKIKKEIMNKFIDIVAFTPPPRKKGKVN